MLEKTLLVRTLRSALESYKFPFNTITALFIISGDSGQIPLELWPSWRHEEDVFPLSHGASRPDGSEAQSVVRCCLPPGGFICSCHSTLLNMPQGMCPYLEDHSLDLPRRLGQLGDGTLLRLRHPGDALNLRLLLLPAELSNSLLGRVLRPRRICPIPQGVFRG